MVPEPHHFSRDPSALIIRFDVADIAHRRPGPLAFNNQSNYLRGAPVIADRFRSFGQGLKGLSRKWGLSSFSLLGQSALDLFHDPIKLAFEGGVDDPQFRFQEPAPGGDGLVLQDFYPFPVIQHPGDLIRMGQKIFIIHRVDVEDDPAVFLGLFAGPPTRCL